MHIRPWELPQAPALWLGTGKPMSQEIEPIAVSIAGAAKRLGVGKSTIRCMIQDGRLPHTRLVGRVGERGTIRIKLSDVDALLTSPSEPAGA
jgi:excisionase family DNA binding protein